MLETYMKIDLIFKEIDVSKITEVRSEKSIVSWILFLPQQTLVHFSQTSLFIEKLNFDQEELNFVMLFY